ncbi:MULTISPECIES: CBS domain-containing protein [Thermomonospora]|uniref:CBS domain containing protein n=1 Tax=Thermomonospora curvata (strain ATCC 19995 / DSM 43183 / JCM 3096 / KCTC 9072 / NBRC 15933 / NCIMB 10081 / Henssen B9) TaxID=471852 RepID=D1AC15_THECD|nr:MULTISPECIES: CBS domain-containing protein [Thermomonospora]ACY97281.1 CBS domain containing protein [Thermomonospora curvata DSM 43183]PKK14650.1 MAG: CBS domain-containing protein [Thermomonospora sp. CIF 1]
MLARELARPYPHIDPDSEALSVARLVIEQRLPGLIVLDDLQHPLAILPTSQILWFAIPPYVREDPALARVYSERQADRMCERMRGRSLRDLLPPEPRRPPMVTGDANVLEVATLMAQAHSPLVAVVESKNGPRPPMIGVISVADLLGRLLPAC